jgi:hypothetical protein
MIRLTAARHIAPYTRVILTINDNAAASAA